MVGIALHIGLNAVDASHYAGWSGTLTGCENDARDMALLTRAQGFAPTVVLTDQAQTQRIIAFLTATARELTAGDEFILTFSGHGSQVPDRNDFDEDDGLDETWLFFDRMLIDDELYAALGQFRPGVRILVISDCCHSGTVLRSPLYRDLNRLPQLRVGSHSPEPRFRVMPPDIATATYRLHRLLYDQVQDDTGGVSSRSVSADLILLSACQDNQVAADGEENGLFTATLKHVWNNGQFVGNHKAFWQGIVREMPPTQVPNYVTLGSDVRSFEAERPFVLIHNGAQATSTPLTQPNGTFGLTIHSEEETMENLSTINGNWETVAVELSKRLQGERGDGDLLSRIVAQNAQTAQATFFGHSPQPTTALSVPAPSLPSTAVQSRGGTVARAFWWGFHIEISHEDLQNFLNSANPVAALIGTLGTSIPSPASPFIALAAAFVAGALGLLRSLDQGRGIYISMSWFAPGIFIPTSV